MNPVLIYTDITRIEREKEFLDDSVALFQSIYDALTALGINVTLNEINNLVSWTYRGNGGPNFEQEFVINKLLDAATYMVNGITVTREGMRSIMAIPDVSSVITALKGVGYLYSNNLGVNAVEIALLILTAGVVAKVPTAYDTITAKYTYYTQTDASAALANSLQGVCDALNTHDAAYKDAILIGCDAGTQPAVQALTQMKGIAIIGDEFTPSLSYIRKFEQTGSLFTT
ncbi:hypothetical protein [Mucilaginibacter sp.]|uniref:hypothetical protein n=1 Tax=Mucilaginibacter sp. TaxID=1882438 RepID=UPI002624587A|nr:hypothetical protein [Mucilaginibacter sp.]MDB5029727.1 hypothetical protein [Mucilaginibacter sp.]